MDLKFLILAIIGFNSFAFGDQSVRKFLSLI